MTVAWVCKQLSGIIVGMRYLGVRSLLFECGKGYPLHPKFDVGADGETVGNLGQKWQNWSIRSYVELGGIVGFI